MPERVVVVGGDAAGMTAASQLRRRADPSDVEIVVLERSPWVSYSACGIPYWVAGQVAGPDALVARTAAEHRARGIEVRLGCEATEIDLATGHVRTAAGESLGFDELVIATGAVPKRPDLPGIDCALGVQTLQDGQQVLDRLGQLADGSRAVVVGAGYIGVEMAEAMVRRGLTVTLVDSGPEPMHTLDPDMGALIRTAMTGMGITVSTGATVVGVETAADGNARRVVTDQGEHDADIV
ncbi:MAG TPA: FAD-dependent oxidoreductase, partial [Candidatus Nanopelagicales bacterium]|nr:FAD-dependent oxidoreductase [Candidatus Nanopelagicales bacterium]